MNEMSRAEAAGASREAQDRVVSSPRTSSTTAVEAAMKRYLSAEQYHQLSEADHTAEDEGVEQGD